MRRIAVTFGVLGCILAACMESPSDGSPETTRSSMDLRRVDWKNTTIPAVACSPGNQATFKEGEGSFTDGAVGEILVELVDPVVYGDIDGDGSDDAAIGMNCYVDGTSGSFGQGYTVVSGEHTALRLLGIIIAQHKGSGIYSPLVESVNFAATEITAEERWFTDTDPRCCPTGRAATEWRFSEGKLIPVATVAHG